MTQYLYTGSSPDLSEHHIYWKFGGTRYLKNRLDTYLTSFPVNPFQYECVYSINEEIDFKEVERLITLDLVNTRKNGGNSGTEWYPRNILTKNYIENKLLRLEIEYQELSPEEIENINRKVRSPNDKKKETAEIVPYDYQHKTLQDLYAYYETGNIANVLWTCGLGKTLLGLFTAVLLQSKKILICTPSIQLLVQWKKTLQRYFPKLGLIKCIDKDSVGKISKKLLSRKNLVLICTYHQTYKIAAIQRNTEETYFDFKIGDEAHHLVGIDSGKEMQFKKFHEVNSKKTLFLTATKKIKDSNYIEGIQQMYSMDQKMQFGETVDEKSVAWAIEKGYLVDYSLVDIVNTQEEINNIMDELNVIGLLQTSPHQEYALDLKNRDKIDQLFLSSYIAIKEINEIEGLDKLLIYANTIRHADLIKYFCNIIIQSGFFDIKKEDIYYNDLHSGRSDLNMLEELGKFKTTPFGIIACVQIFGEGYNEPLLDGVVFSEKMESKIRIIQSTLRPHRLNQNKPEKHAYILIPRVDYEACDEEGQCDPFEKIEQIGIHLKNVDENIYARILSIDVSKKYRKKITYKSKKLDTTEIRNKIIDTIKTRIRLAGNIKLTLTKFCNIMKDNNISNLEEYYLYLENSDSILPRNVLKTFPEFCWRLVDKNQERYYDKLECIQKLTEIRNTYEERIDEMEDYEDRLEFIHKIDTKIPNRDLYKYYGGEEKNYLFFN